MASQIRILNNNAADRATLSASTTSSSLVVDNLKTDYKAAVYRSTGTTTTITATWASNETIGVVVVPFCNLTATATMRVRLFTNTGDASPAYDSGNVLAGASVPTDAWEWGSTPLGVNAYSYVGAAYGRCYTTPTVCRKMEVIITDTSNASGYVEAARLVCGNYYNPENDADIGVSIEFPENSVSTRNDASDLITDIGTRTKKLSFNLNNMTVTDRNKILALLKSNGTSRPMFISLMANDGDITNEQHYQIYGKLAQNTAVSIAYWQGYMSAISIEEC
jgi:hypothetical protein